MKDKITHIWFSHEHPDHFSVPSLKKIKAECLNLKAVIFQKTRDHRVENFCKKLDINIITLGHLSEHRLTDCVSIKIGQVNKIDSYSILTLGDQVIVNTNDCILSQKSLEEIAHHSPSCDLLLAQFSYASYISNKDRTDLRIKATQKKLTEIERQSNMLNPKAIVPFASYIYFSHEENFYMNDALANLSDVTEKIQSLGKKPIVLYPGDEFSLSESENHNSDTSRKKYETDFANISVKNLTAGNECSLVNLQKLSENYLARIRKNNNGILIASIARLELLVQRLGRSISGFGRTKIYLHDLNTLVAFDWIHGLKEINTGQRSDADVEMSSDSLAYSLKFDWGFSSLLVNGRLQEIDAKGVWRVARVFSLGLINSTGRSFSKHMFVRMKGLDNIPITDQEPSYLKKG